MPGITIHSQRAKNLTSSMAPSFSSSGDAIFFGAEVTASVTAAVVVEAVRRVARVADASLSNCREREA